MHYVLKLNKRKFLLLITFLIEVNYSFAYEVYYSDNYNEKLDKYVGECSNKPFSRISYKVDKSTQSVFGKITNLDTGESSEPDFESNCKVIDDKNWSCGHSPDVLPTHTIIWSTTKVMDGKYFYTPSYKVMNGSGKTVFLSQWEEKKSKSNIKICYFDKTIFGFKKQ